MTAAVNFVDSTGYGRKPGEGRGTLDRFASFVRVLDGLPLDGRTAVVAAMAKAYPALDVTLQSRSMTVEIANQGQVGAPAPPHAIADDAATLRRLREALGQDLQVSPVATTLPTPGAPAPRGEVENRLRIGVELRDGAIVAATLPRVSGRGPPMRAFVLGTIGFVILNLAALLWWATRGLTAPLTRFAQAAESFSLDGRNPAVPLPEQGPDEVRTAARALNRMQARIRHMVDDRTRMLAAISHDLRTPITRLRLRAEFVEDEEMRAQMLRDLDQMGAMVHAALAYLRDGQAPQSRSLVDLAILLQTICNDFADMGESISYEGPDHLLVRVRSDEIQRAVTNLVENAVKHGGRRAVVRLREASAEAIEIEVIDDGPGIPDGQKAAMVEPFARGDASRSLNDAVSGFGLGLAIARSIAEAHGGELSLHDVGERASGLVARLRLPV
jgi:signal transduction histidine kinase